MMVEKPRHSGQTDFDYVQNLFDQVEPERATPELKAEILRTAPSGDLGAIAGKSSLGLKADLAELIDYLWPFGALWRPAAGLAAAAMLGAMLGVTDPLSPNGVSESDDVLTEEIVAFAFSTERDLEELQ